MTSPVRERLARKAKALSPYSAVSTTTAAPTTTINDMMAILKNPDPTKEELAKQTFDSFTKTLDTLDKKYGIDADDLLKVLEDEGPEALKKVFDGLKEQTPDDLFRWGALSSASISLSLYTFAALELKTSNGDAKPPAEPDEMDEFDKLLFEVDEKTKEDSAEALRIAEETQRKVDEFEGILALHGGDIATLKEQVQELKASDARVWDAIEKLQNPQE